LKIKIADGRNFQKSFFYYISAGNQPTSTKFGALTRIFIPRMAR